MKKHAVRVSDQVRHKPGCRASEVRPNPTTDYGVSCPRASEKLMNKVVATLAPSWEKCCGRSSAFIIYCIFDIFAGNERTCIKAFMSLSFDQIPPLTMNLAVIERLKNKCFHFLHIRKQRRRSTAQ